MLFFVLQFLFFVSRGKAFDLLRKSRIEGFVWDKVDTMTHPLKPPLEKKEKNIHIVMIEINVTLFSIF